jgi:hypothetical protein
MNPVEPLFPFARGFFEEARDALLQIEHHFEGDFAAAFNLLRSARAACWWALTCSPQVPS